MSTRQAYPAPAPDKDTTCDGCGTRVGKLKALLKMPDGSFLRARAYIHARFTVVPNTGGMLGLLCPRCRKLAIEMRDVTDEEPETRREVGSPNA